MDISVSYSFKQPRCHTQTQTQTLKVMDVPLILCQKWNISRNVVTLRKTYYSGDVSFFNLEHRLRNVNYVVTPQKNIKAI